MRHETFAVPPRAVVGPLRANTDPKVVVGNLVTAFEEFKTRHEGRVGNFQAAVDDINVKIAALNLNGPLGDVSASPDPAYTGLFASWARTGSNAQELVAANREGPRQAINAAMTTTPGEAGGYLAPIEWDRQIRKAEKPLSPMRQIANVVQTSVRGYSTLWNMGGWGSGWVGETASRPATNTAELRPINFAHGELYAFPMVSQQLLDDADFRLEQWLADEVSEEFARQEGITFLSGDGVNKPRGLLTYVTGGASATEHPGGVIATTPSGAASSISTDSLITLLYALGAPYRQNARWLMNSSTVAAVSKFKDAGGNYIWQPSYSEGRPATILGYPITVDESMPDVAAGSLPIAFGDFKRGYVINDRTGIRVLRDPYTAKPFCGFYTTKRVGGGVMDPNAIRLLKVAAS